MTKETKLTIQIEDKQAREVIMKLTERVERLEKKIKEIGK